MLDYAVLILLQVGFITVHIHSIFYILGHSSLAIVIASYMYMYKMDRVLRE